MINTKIKKELTQDQFSTLIDRCENEFRDIEDISKIILECEEKTKEITPAEEVYILLIDDEVKNFDVVTLGKKIPMNIDKESIVSECIHSKQALIVNDVTHSFLYEEVYDNSFEFEIKDLMVVPVLDDSSKKNVLAILWAAIPKGNLNQYMQIDIEYMTRFSIFIKRFFQQKDPVGEKSTNDVDFSDCMEAYNKLNSRLRREQEYFSSIIHDIRTPMNGVLGFLELLKLNETDANKKDYIDTALKSGESMVALIGDALDISKLSSGKMSVEKVSFSPLSELSDTAKLFYNSAKRKEISLEVYYDPLLPKIINSDYHRIKQIMNNLLNNAIKFTPNKGTIILELFYEEVTDGLTISIKDDGIGIAKEMQESIFTAYTQEKSSTSREYGGTGLGLSISQQLSVLLGGKLQLESEEGEGSRFFFTIPCSTEEGMASSIEITEEKIQNLSVMVYFSDSENHIMETTKRYLTSMNINVLDSIQGESLHALKEKKFDLFFILKKDTDGYEEEIQLILDSGRAVIITDEKYFDEHNWYYGNIERVNSPLLPDTLYKTITALIVPEEKVEKDETTLVNLQKIRGKHVLVVDDSDINLKIMKEMLKVLNVKVSLAQSGEHGIEMFESENPDIIFMDENMPGMQGYEAISVVRSLEQKNKKKSVVIIGLTGDADQKTEEILLRAGANSVLTKPIQLQSLQDTLVEYL